MPRRTSRDQLLARQSPPRHENSWRFRVDLGYVGESALSTGRIELSLCTTLSATSHGLRMTLGMNDPGSSCTVPGGDTAHMAHTVRLPNVLRRCGIFPRYGKLFFRYLAGVENFPRHAKKVLLITTLNQSYGWYVPLAFFFLCASLEAGLRLSRLTCARQ